MSCTGWLLRGVLAWLVLLVANPVLAACAPPQVLRDDVLVVENANSSWSTQIGDYYCEQRGIDPANIARVYLSLSNDVRMDDFISLRDQLIRFLQENTLNGNETPVVCDVTQGYTRYYCPESIEQIRRLTRIRYLVTTRGIPVQFLFAGSTLVSTPVTSTDNYLRFWLLNYFPADQSFRIFTRTAAFADGRGMRSVDPSVDGEFIVGRIDGINPANAMRVIDRTLEAERKGVYGKLYGSRFGPLAQFTTPQGAYWKAWSASGSKSTVYPSPDYLHGLFGTLQGSGTTGIYHADKPDCVSYDASGKSPQDCVTRLTEGGTGNVGGNDLGPGEPAGRVPIPDHALVYQGYADGQFSTFLGFDSLLNWRNNAGCNTLCSPGDAACKAASTDVYREIDTRCVRLADGFIGYNFRSFPVGLMAGSPTAWYLDSSQGSTLWNSNGAINAHYWFPEVREDDGFDDNYSLWYRNVDLLPTALCYGSGDDLDVPPARACNSNKKININQRVSIPEQQVNLASPQTVTVRFRYRALDLNQNLFLLVRLFVHESVYQDATLSIQDNNQIDYQTVPAVQLTAPDLPADRTSWAEAVATFTLDPALHKHPQYRFDGLKIRIESDRPFEGQLAIDTVAVDIDGVDVQLQNPGFSDGHRQLSGGDSAASFLGRLNGIAFWSNLTHHESQGHSFDAHPFETLIYFLRGLPLGDAVWFAEFHNSGIFYGDPLYSPIAVHLHYLAGSMPGQPQDTFDRQVPLALRGDTVNGTGSDVTTTYSVSYCQGRDFYPCDLGQTWLPVANMQNRPGGSRDMALGDWDVTTLAAGDYTLRLAVTSANAASGMMQTFNDYYPLSLQGTAPAPPPGGGGGSTTGTTGGTGTAGSGGGGCATGGRRAAGVDPLLPLLLAMAVLGLVGNMRRRST